MSFDLIIFDPENAPRQKPAFVQWLKAHEEDEGPQYDHPDACSARLRGWFLDVIEEFPPMNGPWAAEDYDNPCVTEYSVSKYVICARIAWSQAESAYTKMRDLSDKHGVGFYNLSSDAEEPLFPGRTSVSGTSTRKPWWKLW
jgi:hypothetical protein